jgi:hypothetical protein
METHPYRGSDDPRAAVPTETRCIVCKTREALRRVRWKNVTFGAVAVMFATVNVASAFVVHRSLLDTERALSRAEALSLVANTAWHERQRQRPPPAQKTAEAKPPRPQASPPPKPPPSCESRIAQGVLRISPTEYYVDRYVITRALEDGAALTGSPRLLPEQENGQTLGVRVFGIDPEGLFGILGIQSGDRINAIDGVFVHSPEDALAAYAKLRAASTVTVRLERRGSVVSLHYHLV